MVGKMAPRKVEKPEKSQGKGAQAVWPAMESNACLSNSEKGAGLTQPCGCGFMGDGISAGLLGKKLSH